MDGATRFVALALSMSTVAACHMDSNAPEAFTVRDSAGVSITESVVPLWSRDQGWAVEEEPEVVIGQVDGDERYLLDEVHGVRRFPDGRIAILDRGSARVRVYDPGGGHLFDAGGPGEGPTEFLSPQYLDLMGDTILVYQNGPPKVTWFDGGGRFIRTTTLHTASDGRPLLGYGFGILEQEAVAVAAIEPGRPVREPGMARESMALWRVALDGSRADSLLEIQTDEIVVHTSGGWNQLPFGKTTYYAASDEGIYVGPSDDYSIQVLDARGRLVRIFRRAHEQRPVVASDIDRYAEQVVAATFGEPERVQALARRIREIGAAEEMPAFRLLVADSEENLWVEDWDDVGMDQGAFSVFRSDGAWLGRVDLPPGLPWLRGVNLRTSLLEIGRDYVLGVWVAELGVEQVRLYRIRKSEATSQGP